MVDDLGQLFLEESQSDPQVLGVVGRGGFLGGGLVLVVVQGFPGEKKRTK